MQEVGAPTVERWGLFELKLPGPADRNPFVDVRFSARFSRGHCALEVDGFYDGDGVYRVRVMPDVEGDWHYTTRSNVAELDDVQGGFTCVPPTGRNHGPVGVSRTYHFAYADGTPYRELGTTCYAWAHQGEIMELRTLDTLGAAPFDKLRMCVFPKHYNYNANEPEHYPFEGSASGGWDFARFEPQFWRHLECRVRDLRDLGIEADVILFHPYDRWGFAAMDAESDDRYLRYCLSRLSSYRNVWWSLANEWDLMRTKTEADWDRFFRVVQECDPYQHLRSIHNCHRFYDHAKPWVTHLSIQRSDVEQTRVWRETYRKPAVVDECCYEGNIPERWGDISAQEMVRRFWETTARGGYCGHGETYLDPEDVLWWSKGGTLHGESPSRLEFMRRMLSAAPAEGLEPLDGVIRHDHPCAGKAGEYYLVYFGLHQPARVTLNLPDERRFSVEAVDTWGMTVEPRGEATGSVTVDLPGRPYFALIARRVG